MNERQRRFADEYMIDSNATQAAIRAGYSEKTAYSQGPRLLENVEIKEYIQKEQKRIASMKNITKEMIVEELAKIAFGDVRAIVNWTTNRVVLVPSKEIADHDAATVSEVSEGKFGITVKRYDKVRALDQLTKILGFDAKDPTGDIPTLVVDEP